MTTALAGDPLVEAVIVAFRSRELVRACVTSIERHGTVHGRVAINVVDNASDDGTVEMLRADFPAVRIWPLDHNAGFAAANNLALQATVAPYVLVLNPDTELRPGVLDRLLTDMDEDSAIGMAGCRLEQRDGRFDHAAKRSFPTPLAALAHFAGVGRRTTAWGPLAQYRAPDLSEHDVGDVDAINGAFMFVRREAMEDVGLFDPGYWLYMEDLDWCRRFHERGWRVLYDGRVTALHLKGGSAGRYRGPRQNVAFHRGMGRFYRRFEAGKKPVVDVFVYAAILGKLVASLARSEAARRTGRRR